MIVEILTEVPDSIFNSCLYELSKINWNLVDDERKNGVFETSTSIHLRSPDTKNLADKPSSIEAYSEIIDCKDNPGLISQFPGHYIAAHWIKKQVHGIKVGRVMIVNLAPKGKILLHKDPGPYFEKYSRYHIPLKTNQDVYFIDKNNNRAHMPQKNLCRLNNLDYHGLLNESNEDRIHLIVDVEVAGGNGVF